MIIQRAKEILRNDGFFVLLKKGFFSIINKTPPLRVFFLYSLLFKFFKIKNKKLSVDELVDLVYLHFYGLMRPKQVKSEIVELLKIINENKPKIVLEIGTANGGTLFLFSQLSAPIAEIISIDLPHGEFGGGYPDWKTYIYKHFGLHDQKIHLIRADSHNEDTFMNISNTLREKEIDFLFIDGDHSYEGVKNDYERYSSLVKTGGIIALHDVVEHTEESGCNVNRFWEEIKSSNKYLEFIENHDQKWAGVGVIIKS